MDIHGILYIPPPRGLHPSPYSHSYSHSTYPPSTKAPPSSSTTLTMSKELTAVATTSAPPAPTAQHAESNADEYGGFMLYIYDTLVLTFLCTFVYRCPTSKITLPLFRDNVSARHLDVGVGTGYFTKHGNLPRGCDLTLCDLNQNCLDMAKKRLVHSGRRDVSISTLQWDIYKSLPAEHHGAYSSISILYLLHCLPGPSARKCAVFANLKAALTPEGVLFGANILGEKRVQSRLSGLWVKRTNRRGFMDNLGDNEREFTEALREQFEEVEAGVVGCIYVFKASRPKFVEGQGFF